MTTDMICEVADLDAFETWGIYDYSDIEDDVLSRLDLLSVETPWLAYTTTS